jgi:hypothetical protein
MELTCKKIYIVFCGIPCHARFIRIKSVYYGRTELVIFLFVFL